jgi:hypothetical protein
VTDARGLVQAEWLRRVEAEYRSSAITQTLTLWMTQAAVSPDLIAEGLRIAQDELDHAALSMEVFVAAGGEGMPALPRASLTFPTTPGLSLEEDITLVALEVFCLGETVAVPLFRSLREACEEPVARVALDRILVDEVRHRDFGWALLEWMIELDGRLRARVSARLPAAFAAVARSYAPAFSGGPALPTEARRWGLMDPDEYAACVTKTFARDWEPRLKRLAIDAGPAWASVPG